MPVHTRTGVRHAEEGFRRTRKDESDNKLEAIMQPRTPTHVHLGDDQHSFAASEVVEFQPLDLPGHDEEPYFEGQFGTRELTMR